MRMGRPNELQHHAGRGLEAGAEHLGVERAEGFEDLGGFAHGQRVRGGDGGDRLDPTHLGRRVDDAGTAEADAHHADAGRVDAALAPQELGGSGHVVFESGAAQGAWVSAVSVEFEGHDLNARSQEGLDVEVVGQDLLSGRAMHQA